MTTSHHITLTAINNKINKKLEQKNDLLGRICGLSDDIMLEQARAEYLLLEEQIESIEKDYMHQKFVCLADEYRTFYTEMFIIEPNIILALELTNNTIFDRNELFTFIHNHKLRIPSSLQDRRLLAILSGVLQRQILILDMESIILDEIGKCYENQQLKLYVKCLSRIEDYETMDPIDKPTIVHKANIV